MPGRDDPEPSVVLEGVAAACNAAQVLIEKILADTGEIRAQRSRREEASMEALPAGFFFFLRAVATKDELNVDRVRDIIGLTNEDPRDVARTATSVTATSTMPTSVTFASSPNGYSVSTSIEAPSVATSALSGA